MIKLMSASVQYPIRNRHRIMLDFNTIPMIAAADAITHPAMFKLSYKSLVFEENANLSAIKRVIG